MAGPETTVCRLHRRQVPVGQVRRVCVGSRSVLDTVVAVSGEAKGVAEDRRARAGAMAAEVIQRGQAGDAQGALAVIGEFLGIYDAESGAEYRGLVADALAIKLDLLSEIGRLEDALAAAGDLYTRYASAPEPDLPYAAAFGLRAQVALLLNLGRVDEAAAGSAKLGRLFEQRADAGRQPELAEQLIEVGYMLMIRGRDAQALALSELVIDRFRVSQEPQERELLAAAQLNLVIARIHLGDPEGLPEEIAKLQEMGQAALPPIDRLVSRLTGRAARRFDLVAVLENKIGVLLKLGRTDAASHAAHDLVALLDADESPQAQTLLRHVREQLGDLI